MKKFFSLVLALVMALSLTTVAWGAASVSDLAGLKAKIAGGETVINVTSPITVNENLTLTNVTINGGDFTDDLFKVGAGYTLTLGEGVVISAKETAVHAAGVGANVIINAGTLTSATGSTALASDGGTVTVNGGALISSQSRALTAAKGSTSGGTVIVNNGTVEGVFVYDEPDTVTTNSTSTGIINGGTFTWQVDVHDNASLTITGGTFQEVVGGYGGPLAMFDATGDITIAGGTFQKAVGGANNTDITITGGTFATDVSANVVPGYALVNGTVVNNAGQFNTLTGGVGANAATGTYGATLEAALADTTYSAVMQPYAPAVPAVKSFSTCGLIVTHKTNQTVNTYGAFVKVPTALNANYVYVSGSNIVYLANVPATNKYDADATAVAVGYNTAAAAKCNEAYVDDLTEAGTYYLYEDEYYEEVTFAQKEKTFNVNDVMVYAAKTTKVNVKDHAYKYDTLKTNDALGKTVTNVYCTACNTTFEFVDSSNEADAIKKFGAGNYEAAIAGVKGTIYVRTGYTAPILPSGTVVTPSTDKVTSAETFDAGIAMYVGMSVLAATGSAVVIGKKKH